MRRGAVAAMLIGLVLAAPARAGYQTDVPYQAGSPWPSMRHDRHNTGRSTIPSVYHGDKPWEYRTGKGIFSTPVIGADGTAYVGSADTFFYAIAPDGKLRWKYKIDGLIDSAAVLGAAESGAPNGTVTFGGGDDLIHRLTVDATSPSGATSRRVTRKRGGHRHRRAALRSAAASSNPAPQPRQLWQFKATQPPEPGQLVNWWEGNVVMGPGGTLYAGNTGGYEYAVNPNGTQKWVYAAGNSVWTAAAIGDDGTDYVGSLDAFAYALDQNGQRKWRTPTAGFIVSSPVIGDDGTVYFASFDSNLYALDPSTGAPKWKFATGDHIYGSPALGADGTIYVASADGNVYALSPSGQLVWRYETGDVVRSSPVIAPAPPGDAHGNVVYVGSANGVLYALNADDGTRRWSYDTTPDDPVLRDRNDLNASPALSANGIVIGSEDGSINYVPYDYCVHAQDSRCRTGPAQAFGDNISRVFPVTAGGTTELGGALEDRVATASTFTGRLVVRSQGQTQDASMQPVPSAHDLVSTNPPFDFTAELSGDGHFLFVVPNDFLKPDTDYTLTVQAPYSAQGLRVGNLTVGATTGGAVTDTMRFRTAPAGGPLPLSVSGDRVTAFRLRRLAIPIPSFVPSVNQIGFDQYELIVGTLAVSPPDSSGTGNVVLWATGAKQDDAGNWVPDPQSTVAFPLAGRYRGDELILTDQNVNITFSFGDVPLARLILAGQLQPDFTMRPGASLYGEVNCKDVPNYGPFLFVTRLCNNEGKLVASGTFLTQSYQEPAGAGQSRQCTYTKRRRGHRHRAHTAASHCTSSSTAPQAPNTRPPGLSVSSFNLQRPTASDDGFADARLSLAGGASYAGADHTGTIVLVDPATGQIVAGPNYRKGVTLNKDARGNLSEIRLAIPAGTILPERVRAYAVTDVFPLAAKDF